MDEGTPHSIKFACHHINEKLVEIKSIQLLADDLRMNSTYLGALFKEKMGIKLGDYVLMKKVERAKYLLKHTNYRIKEISNKSGFDQMRSFSRVFKNITKMTPSEFRNS